jgi:hypothetical protein
MVNKKGQNKFQEKRIRTPYRQSFLFSPQALYPLVKNNFSDFRLSSPPPFSHKTRTPTSAN